MAEVGGCLGWLQFYDFLEFHQFQWMKYYRQAFLRCVTIASKFWDTDVGFTKWIDYLNYASCIKATRKKVPQEFSDPYQLPPCCVLL